MGISIVERFYKWLNRIKGISDSSVISNNKYYQKIIDLGFPAIPFLLKEQVSYHSYNDYIGICLH